MPGLDSGDGLVSDGLTRLNKEMVEEVDHFKCSIYEGKVIIQRKGDAMDVICDEPDMLNPNGYHNIATILRNLGYRAGRYIYTFFYANSN